MQLNLEERRIINAKSNGHTLIKRLAGSGKTTIVINRLPVLLYEYCFDVDEQTLLLTYNKTLVNYFKFEQNEIIKGNMPKYGEFQHCKKHTVLLMLNVFFEWGTALVFYCIYRY